MSAPKISVVIPTLNSARFVGEAIDSILKQSVPVGEILVVDGGSTDETPAIVRAKSGLVQVLSQEGRGRAGARNTGLRRATGDFIALLDSDDLWAADKLAIQFDFLREHPEVEFVFGDMANFTDGESEDVPEILDAKVHDYLKQNPANPLRMLECLLKLNLIPTSSVLFKKTCLQSVGFMNEEFTHCEDYEYWLRFAENSRMGFVAQILARRRLHGSNAMNDAYVNNCEATLKLLYYWRKKNDLTSDASSTLLQRIALIRYNLSSHLLKSGRFADAYELLRDLRRDGGKTSAPSRFKVWLKFHSAKWLKKFKE
jgi:glycosyltransferase involved in cell wall biosynthesis